LIIKKLGLEVEISSVFVKKLLQSSGSAVDLYKKYEPDGGQASIYFEIILSFLPSSGEATSA
jgi:hypothetical protein